MIACKRTCNNTSCRESNRVEGKNAESWDQNDATSYRQSDTSRGSNMGMIPLELRHLVLRSPKRICVYFGLD
jgi:hypothetical protein